MANYIITGKPGNGKTLTMVAKMSEYLNSGRKVASNIDLNLVNVMGINTRHVDAVRIPDIPTSHNLKALGLGYDGEYKNESFNGGIFLDESALYLNTRDFADKDMKAERKLILNFLLLARHKRWDVYFGIQNYEVLDKQFRLSLAEHVVYCRRMDRMRIPFFGDIVYWLSLTMIDLKLAAFKARVMHGHGQSAAKVGSWWYQGANVFDCYDTEQPFDPDGSKINYTYPQPYEGVKPNVKKYYKEKFISNYKRVSIPQKSLFFLGILFGWYWVAPTYAETDINPFSGNEEVVEVPKSHISPGAQNNEDSVYYIAGSITFDGVKTYLFQDESGNAYYPEWDRYKVRPVHACKVALIKKGSMIFAKCPHADTGLMTSGASGKGTTTSDGFLDSFANQFGSKPKTDTEENTNDS